MKLHLMGRKTPNLPPKESIPENIAKGAQLAGKIRKSSFFGGWEDKIAAFNSGGLTVYKKPDKPAFVIPYNSIKEIWTRF